MADDSSQMPPAGWLPDPMGQPGTLRYWDGARWTQRVAHVGVGPAPVAAPHGRPKRRSTIKWSALAAFVLVVVVVAFALSRGQEVKRVSADGSIEFYSSGDRAAAEPEVVRESIEAQQPEVDAQVADLAAAAQQSGANDAQVADFGGTWIGANGLTYVISQFGDAAVIEERTAFGTSAYGEGTVRGGRAQFFFVAFDGTQGQADLTLVNESRIEGTFLNFAFGSSPAVLTRN